MHRQDNALIACSRPELMSRAPDIFGVKALMYELLSI
jgi:hypothetical protein